MTKLLMKKNVQLNISIFQTESSIYTVLKENSWNQSAVWFNLFN